MEKSEEEEEGYSNWTVQPWNCQSLSEIGLDVAKAANTQAECPLSTKSEEEEFEGRSQGEETMADESIIRDDPGIQLLNAASNWLKVRCMHELFQRLVI